MSKLEGKITIDTDTYIVSFYGNDEKKSQALCMIYEKKLEAEYERGKKSVVNNILKAVEKFVN